MTSCTSNGWIAVPVAAVKKATIGSTGFAVASRSDETRNNAASAHAAVGSGPEHEGLQGVCLSMAIDV
jgi:hypothetical protein